MLKNFKPGYNLTLLNTIYHRPRKLENNKYSDDAISIIYKDNETKIKYLETIHSPDYEYYIAKEGISFDHNQLFTEIENVEKVSCVYRELEKDIAERTNNLEYFYDNLRQGNYMANRRLHTHPSVFLSDMQIEDHYRFRFNLLYGEPDISNITKSYLDIEADTIDMEGDFPELGECPINAVTIIDGTSNKVYTLLLRNESNPLIKEFENELKMNNKFFIDLINTITDTVGGKKNMIRYKLDKLDFGIYFFDDELDLINNIFNIVNRTKPDFLLAWNMAFDVPYIIERLKKLGVNPESVMSHPDFDIKEAYYHIDSRNENELAERGDYARISSYTVYLDQMIHFASRRKGQSAFKSHRLDYIGQVIAKVKKLDFSHITTDISKFPYLDYKLFVMYNIIDTIVQKCIEIKTDDIGFVFGKANMNFTRYDKCHRNTIYLKNRGVGEFYKNGYIMGNNTNLDNSKTKFVGALVSNPLLNLPNGVKLNGTPIRIYNNVVDYDFKSLYPSLITEFNMAPHTQIGRIIIDDVINENENKFGDEDYERSGAFIDDIASRNYITLCSRWFNMPTYKDLYDNIINHYNYLFLQPVNINGEIQVLKIVKDYNTITPFIITQDQYINPISIYKPMPSRKE